MKIRNSEKVVKCGKSRQPVAYLHAQGKLGFGKGAVVYLAAPRNFYSITS